MEKPNLVELAEVLNTNDLAELLARRLCLEVQEIAKDQIENLEDDPEAVEAYTAMLTDPDAMCAEAESVAFEGWFHHYDLSDMVDKALERVAEEYVR